MNERPKQFDDRNIYPPGWNNALAREVAAYYDARKNEVVLDERAIEINGLGNLSIDADLQRD